MTDVGLILFGGRFLHCAMLRIAPVEMTRGGFRITSVEMTLIDNILFLDSPHSAALRMKLKVIIPKALGFEAATPEKMINDSFDVAQDKY